MRTMMIKFHLGWNDDVIMMKTKNDIHSDYGITITMTITITITD